MKKIYDISLTLENDLPVWPGDKNPELEQTSFMEKGDVCNVGRFSMGMHTGTHIDVPLHFINDGKSTEDVDLSRFIGRAKVFEVEVPLKIELEHVQNFDIGEDDIIILKVPKNESLLKIKEFSKDYVSLSLEAAQFFANKKIKAVGINYFSIEKFDSSKFAVHKTLLGNDIVVIEGLKLEGIEPGEYEFFCLPLKLKNGNGSPVRAVLMK
ncbi:MAG: cyclase family protein [Clostridia bacterium]|nr:cyclase family protein [Clostridia bacterium]